MVVTIALASALCYAAAMVLQQRSARASDPDASLRPRLVVQLARRPAWLAGVVANVAGYGLRFVALGRGSLTVVQPLLVTSLLCALPTSARLHRQRLRRPEWAAALAVAAGLALFLVLGGRASGRAGAGAGAWLAAAAAVGVPAALLVSLGRRRAGPGRAALLAGAGGALLALTAALTKAVATASRAHLLHVLVTWQPYALVAAGAVAVVVVQSAFAAAPLTASLPVLMVVEPLASVAIGVALFHEHLATGLGAAMGEVTGLVLVAVGVAWLAGSALVTGETVAVAA